MAQTKKNTAQSDGKKSQLKLTLKSLRQLNVSELGRVHGGASRVMITSKCTPLTQ